MTKTIAVLKRFLGYFVFSSVSIGLTGCAMYSGTPFASPVSSTTIGLYTKLAEKNEPSLSGDMDAFKKDGHFHTVAYIAAIAGLENRAIELACYSQAPDEIKRYNAVPVAVWGVISWDYRRRIMDTLHSLHGGDYAAVARRRSILHQLVKESSASRTRDWETGFLIHALGDSFAHVHGDLEKPEAFGSLVGHGFEFFNDPDEIFGGAEPNKNYHKYVAYTSSLFEALSTSNNAIGRTALESFQNGIAQKAQAAREPLDVISTLHAYGGTFKEQDCERLYNEIDDTKVRSFLEDLERKLAAG